MGNTLSWEKDRTRKRIQENETSNHFKKPELKPMKQGIQERFDRAISRHAGGEHYSTLLSLQRYLLMNGHLSEKQKEFFEAIEAKL